MTGERTHVLILATEFVRALHRFHPPEEQRVQGRPGGRCTRGSRAKDICASAKTTGTGGDNRPSLRGGLRLIRALLGEPSRLPPSPPRSFSASLGLGAKALGRQDHTSLFSNCRGQSWTKNPLVSVAYRPRLSTTSHPALSKTRPGLKPLSLCTDERDHGTEPAIPTLSELEPCLRLPRIPSLSPGAIASF
jgi:hypothetical protein